MRVRTDCGRLLQKRRGSCQIQTETLVLFPHRLGMDMLGTLLAYRFGMARLLSLVAAFGLTFYLANIRGWPWWAWGPAGAATLLVVPLFWGIFLGLLERRRFAREGWPV